MADETLGKKRSRGSKKTKVDSHPLTPSSTSSDDEFQTGSMHSSNGGKMSVRKETEQRRRNMMNQHFDELVMMLSMVTDRVTPKKMDKTSILEEVVRVIRQYYDLDRPNTVYEDIKYKPKFFSRGELFNFLLDSLGAFLMFVANNGRILYCSDLITSLTGHMPTRLVGQTIYDCVVADDEVEMRSQFTPPANVDGVKIPGSPIIGYPPRTFTCSIKLYSNDPSNMMISQKFVCLSYLRQWVEDEAVNLESCDESSSNDGSCSSCILLIGKLANSEKPRDCSITTNDVNFDFSMRVSKEGKVLEIDKQASLILGFTKSDIQGASFFEYIDPYHSEKIGEAIDTFLSKGLGVSQPYRISSKSGQYIWVVSKGFLSYNPWNHKPDHVLLQCKVLGCDEVLPEYKFKVDAAKMPNTMEDYNPGIDQAVNESHNRQDNLSTDFINEETLCLVSGSQPVIPISTDAIFHPSSVANTFPTQQQPNVTSNQSGNIDDMIQQLDRKNKELFELQQRMLEQQRLFEQERRQFYQVTNQVMTFIGRNERGSTTGLPQYVDSNVPMAASGPHQSEPAALLSSIEKESYPQLSSSQIYGSQLQMANFSSPTQPFPPPMPNYPPPLLNTITESHLDQSAGYSLINPVASQQNSFFSYGSTIVDDKMTYVNHDVISAPSTLPK